MITILLTFTIIVASIHILYLLYFRKGLLIEQTNRNSYYLPSITVIIPVRNEENNILECVNSLLLQTYPKFKYQIIIVDDHSTDSTISKLETILPNDNIQILKVPNDVNSSSKINALTYGINHSTSEIILTIDADCIAPNTLIESHAKLYDEWTSLITGATTFEIRNNSFLENIQALEYAGHNSLLCAVIGKRKLFTANGSNMSFRRNVFELVNGFKNLPISQSGEDTFFAQKVFKLKSYKIKYLLSDEALVISKPAPSWMIYLKQRARWVYQTSNFELETLPFLVITFLFYLCIIICTIFSLYYRNIIPTLLYLFLAKLLTDLFFLFPYLKKLKLFNLLKYFIFAEIIHMPLTILSVFMGYIFNISWKDRNYSK
ncbi:MAG: glycosyltransferase [Ignavibacteria bacterium]|nr:glycosyltransferase [Bacteroidota bacterium]MSQ45627.1 glycosyltransferase [Ignavibacteria bacterium]